MPGSAERAGETTGESMLRVYESGDPSLLLGLSYYMKSKRGFSARFRTENLYYSSSRKSANAKRQIERKSPRGYDGNFNLRAFLAQSHYRFFSKCLLYLRQSGFESVNLFVFRLSSVRNIRFFFFVF